MTPTQQDISNAILDVRKAYLDRGISLFEIGNGHCYDFADDVMDRLFPENWRQIEGTQGWSTLQSECFYLPGEDGLVDAFAANGWDWSLLTEWGIDVPPHERARYDAILANHPVHGWIFFEGRHYDCEHPEGVTNFFELNFFRRHLEGRDLPSSEHPE